MWSGGGVRVYQLEWYIPLSQLQREGEEDLEVQREFFPDLGTSTQHHLFFVTDSANGPIIGTQR